MHCKRSTNIDTAWAHFFRDPGHTALNSDMHAMVHIKENVASKYVTHPRPKMSQPEILILHI